MNISELFYKQFRILEQIQNMIALAPVSPPTRRAAFKTIDVLNSGHPANVRWISLTVEDELLSLGFEVRRLGPPNNHKNTLCEISFGDDKPVKIQPFDALETFKKAMGKMVVNSDMANGIIARFIETHCCKEDFVNHIRAAKKEIKEELKEYGE